MPTIDQLSSTSTLASGDQIPVYDSSEGDARKASLSTLLAWFQGNFASPEFETVTAAPTSSGFTVTLDASEDSIWLVLNPTGTFAAGTVTLPPDEDCFDGQTIVVVCSQALTALTVDGNGATVAGAPSGLGVNGFFSLRYQASATKWWCTSQSLGAANSFSDLTLTGSILDASGDLMLSFGEGGDVVVPGENNRLTVVYAENGGEVGLAAAGDSTDVAISIIPKGTGGFIVNADTVLISTAATTMTGTVDVSSALTADSLKAAAVAVAALGSAATVGVRKFVTDSNATMTAGIGDIVIGGGANKVPVYSDGSFWRIG